MYAALWWLIAIGIIAWLWLDSARAREMAIALVKKLCDQYDVQLLDSTVALRRFGLRWTKQGIRIRRMFSFDFSADGAERRMGYIILLGSQLEQFTGFEDRLDGVEASSTIVPFKQPEKHDK